MVLAMTRMAVHHTGSTCTGLEGSSNAAKDDSHRHTMFIRPGNSINNKFVIDENWIRH
jgi:hypothetical protein